jgi:thiaminase
VSEAISGPGAWDVAYLEGEVDPLAAVAGADESARMAELFELTVYYEIAFCEMAISGESWPGLD